jgi:glycyl-tRNA synthetase
VATRDESRQVDAVLTMQEVLLRLTDFWASRGCTIVQPMNTEVGAGTLNPATFLRVLGPEPWRVAYVEPSVRPDDSRYGDNPNRLQTHTQYQVVLKPEPGDAQQLYLESLRALGIDVRAHDVRFVEDNWASPAIGAWGLGWEVWLDGLEITQFTYFQQAGGLVLDPVSVEITYGIERIVMALQGVAHFRDIAFAPGVTYGDAFGQAEYEMSRYYLDDADLGTNRRLLELYAGEARRLIERELPVPAYTFVLKCSHTFNVLDARGAIGTTERARTFGLIRELAHDVAELWVRSRTAPDRPRAETAAPGGRTAAAVSHIGARPELLVLEIGVEEMPADQVGRSAELAGRLVADGLGATRLRHGAVRTHATPRRVAVLVEDVQPREDDSEQVVRGPRVDAAYDDQGAPTPAARGFAAARGVDVDRLERTAFKGGEFVAVVRRVAGRSAGEVLAGVLPAAVRGLRAEQNMRWGAPDLAFTRPVRWLMALLGEQVVPFAVSSLRSARTTHPLRTAKPPAIDVPSAAAYEPALAASGIVLDAEARRRAVVEGARRLAGEAGGTIDEELDAAVITEIANLVEAPVPILGGFDVAYLDLPAAVLTTVMKKHQRYVPVRDRSGRLQPMFVTFANGPCDVDVVRRGNEAVLRARYEDASFFWRADLGEKPEDMARRLADLTFEERLGSMADRAERIGTIARDLLAEVPLTPPERDVLERASALVKFDLGSAMVIELSSLAGTMAREYAHRAGEPAEVAQALFEVELPRHTGDELPASLPGTVLALADRLDLIAGLFAIGSQPTGTSDQFGLRRAALGVTAMLTSCPRLSRLTLDRGLAVAARHQPLEVPEEATGAAARFIVRRLEQQLLEGGAPVEVVRAVLPLAATPSRAADAAADLRRLLSDATFQQLKTAIQRVGRIVPAGTAAEYAPELLAAPAERRLHEALTGVRARLGSRPAGLGNFAGVALELVQPIDDFFVDVLVMAKETDVRRNRLGLLATIKELAEAELSWGELN